MGVPPRRGLSLPTFALAFRPVGPPGRFPPPASPDILRCRHPRTTAWWGVSGVVVGLVGRVVGRVVEGQAGVVVRLRFSGGGDVRALAAEARRNPGGAPSLSPDRSPVLTLTDPPRSPHPTPHDARPTCSFCAAAISAKPQPGLTTVRVLPNLAAMPSAAEPNCASPGVVGAWSRGGYVVAWSGGGGQGRGIERRVDGAW